MAESTPITGSGNTRPEARYGSLPPTPPEQMSMGAASAEAKVGLEPDEEVSSKFCPNTLSTCLCTCLPWSLAAGFNQIEPREQAAVLYWGKYQGSLRESGLYLLNPCGLELLKVSTKKQTMSMSNMKVLDARGNPVVISGVVTFYGTSAKKARIDVDRPWPMPGVRDNTFLQLQACAVLKRVASRFPYEAPAGEPSLQTEGASIAEQLRQLLQEKVAVTGAFVMSFELVDLSYAPEIAQVMLVRQQAEALVDARRCIVDAAVDMTTNAIKKLRSSGETLDDHTTQAVMTNLLTVICSQVSATPTVPMKTTG